MTLLERINARKQTGEVNVRVNPIVNRPVNLRENQSPWVKARVQRNTPSKDWY